MDGGRRGRILGKAPAALLGMLGLIALVEALVARYRDDFTGAWACQWRQTARAARHCARDCDVLCFGDSLVEYAIVPRVLEARLGGRAYNLALAAGTPPASYFAFRKSLAAGARPRAVVVDFAPHTLAGAPCRETKLWREFVGGTELIDLAWTTRDAGLLGRVGLALGLPSLGCREELRASLVNALASGLHTREARRRGLAAHLRNWRINRGAHLVAKGSKLEGSPDAVGRLFAELAYPDVWRCAPENRRYLRRFFALAASRGIQTYWLLPPCVPEVHNVRNARGLEDSYTRLARSIQAEFPSLTVLDGRSSGYGWDTHIDPFHLDRRGALAFSVEVADAIRARPAGARWIRLPGSRERPTAVVVEDLDESFAALAGEEENRRR